MLNLECQTSGNNEKYMCIRGIISENGIGSGSFANRLDIPVEEARSGKGDSNGTSYGLGFAMLPTSASLPLRYPTLQIELPNSEDLPQNRESHLCFTTPDSLFRVSRAG